MEMRQKFSYIFTQRMRRSDVGKREVKLNVSQCAEWSEVERSGAQSTAHFKQVGANERRQQMALQQRHDLLELARPDQAVAVAVHVHERLARVLLVQLLLTSMLTTFRIWTVLSYRFSQTDVVYSKVDVLYRERRINTITNNYYTVCKRAEARVEQEK